MRLVIALVVLLSCEAHPGAEPDEPDEATAIPVEDPPPRNYAAKMATVDVLLLFAASGAIAYEAVRDGHGSGGGAAAALYGIAVVVGPVRHLGEGNRRQAGRSLARRLLYPAIGAATTAWITNEICDRTAAHGSHWRCAEETLLGVAAGFTAGSVGAMIHDWFNAEVDTKPSRATVPVIGLDEDLVFVGAGGSF